MRIVASALHFEWETIDQCLRRARDEFGIDGVELSWEASFQRPHCTREDFEALAALNCARGRTLTAHIWEDLAQMRPEQGKEVLLRWLDLAQQSGVAGLVIHGGTFPDQKEGIARTRKILESVLAQFELAGVALNLENHYSFDYHNGHELFSASWEFKQIFSLNSPALGFCFDTGHGNMTRNSQALISELAPWLHYVHLADNDGTDDDHAMFRQGTVDWDGILTTLRAIGFNETFCVEFPVREDKGPFNRCVHEIRQRWSDVNRAPQSYG